MNWRERLGRLDRLQQSRGFKIAATSAVVVVALALFIAYFVSVTAPSGVDAGAKVGVQEPAASAAPTAPTTPTTTATGPDAEEAAANANAIKASTEALKSVLAGREDPTSVGVGLAIGTGVATLIIWLGLGLSYLGLAAVAAVVVLPLWAFEGTRELARLAAGVAVLTFAFTALMQALRLLMSGRGAVLAVARNVLVESVRLKISLVLIVLLVFLLASTPLLLDPDTLLRYRVQAFLQYSTGGAFWLIAVLTVLLSVSSVAFEQRDKVIWQTMTKPVAHWKYLLGKWVGVVSLAGVLLLVSGAGVFLFTEYLRGQPAEGERSAFVSGEGEISEDRLILETQVLASRVAVQAEPPFLIDDAEFLKNVEEYIKKDPQLEEQVKADPRLIEKVKSDLYKGGVAAYRSLEPSIAEVYMFTGLEEAKRMDRPLSIRFRVDSGSNAPDKVYRISIGVAGDAPAVRTVGLGQMHTMPLTPYIVLPDNTVLLMDHPNFALALANAQQMGARVMRTSDMINDRGELVLSIRNADIYAGTMNAETITFPPEGLMIAYSAGSYRVNFVRVMLVLWIKLAFLAMLGIWAATFLSFPVACLLAFGAFLAAEGSGFLWSALDYYQTTSDQGRTLYVQTFISWVASAVAWVFRVYSGLTPTERLVEGKLLPWRSVATGLAVLATWTGVLFAAAILIFRRRELATYSGQ